LTLCFIRRSTIKCVTPILNHSFWGACFTIRVQHFVNSYVGWFSTATTRDISGIGSSSLVGTGWGRPRTFHKGPIWNNHEHGQRCSNFPTEVPWAWYKISKDSPHLYYIQIHIIYHLVMTNSLPWKITIFKLGKPSISMGHLYHGELLVITRG
jgi:hypothetical protein